MLCFIWFWMRGKIEPMFGIGIVLLFGYVNWCGSVCVRTFCSISRCEISLMYSFFIVINIIISDGARWQTHYHNGYSWNKVWGALLFHTQQKKQRYRTPNNLCTWCDSNLRLNSYHIFVYLLILFTLEFIEHNVISSTHWMMI